MKNYLILIFSLIAVSVLAQTSGSISQPEHIYDMIIPKGETGPVVSGTFGGVPKSEFIDLDFYQSGEHSYSQYGKGDAFLAKYDSVGHIVWGAALGSEELDVIHSAADLPNGDVAIVGEYAGELTYNNSTVVSNATKDKRHAFVAVLDGANGEVKQFRSLICVGDAIGRFVAVDKSGSIYASGSYEGAFDAGSNQFLGYNGTGADMFVIKMDASLSTQWAIGLGGVEDDQVKGMEVSDKEEVHLIGTFRDRIDMDPSASNSFLVSNGERDIFRAVYNSNGRLNSVVHKGGKYDDDTEGLWIENDQLYIGENIVVDGPQFPYPEPKVVKVFANGEEEEIVKWDGNFNYLEIRDVSVGDGDIYINGHFYDQVDFDPDSTRVNYLQTSGERGNFVLRLDSAGNFISVLDYGQSAGPGKIISKPIGPEKIISVGDFIFDIDLDPGIGLSKFASTGFSNIFLSYYCYPKLYSFQPGAKYYGSGENYRSSKVKTFGSNYYVTGDYLQAGDRMGTISKLDVNNIVEWETMISQDAYIQDIAYDEDTDRIIAVGHLGPHSNAGVANDNRSMIAVFDAKDGSCACQAILPHAGRETFDKIIKHTNPKDLRFPFYVGGGFNDPSSVIPNGSNDFVKLYNIDSRCQIKWSNSYRISGVGDNEFSRGLFAVDDGGVIMLGNDSPTNRGVIVKIDGDNGNVVQSKVLDDGKYDLYDGVQIDNNLIIVGTDFNSSQAVALSVDPSLNFQDFKVFDNIMEFTEVAVDFNKKVYVAGYDTKFSSMNPIINKLYVNAFGQISLEDQREVSPGVVALNLTGVNQMYRPHIHSSANMRGVVYGDNRADASSSSRAYVAHFDHLLNQQCLNPWNINVNFRLPRLNDVSVISKNLTPLPVSAIACGPVTFKCDTACVPSICVADFSVSQNCGEVSITDMSTASANIIGWSWDIDCDGSMDSDVQNPVFNLGCKSYSLCLEITTDDGCVSSYSENITVNDTVPPIIDCPDVFVNGSECSGGAQAFFSLNAFDDCDPSPNVVSSYSSGDFFPCGTTTVNVTATDKCGNSTPCSFDVIVDCNCASIVQSQLSCTQKPGVFAYSIVIESNLGGTNCSSSLSSNVGTIIPDGNADPLMLSGEIELANQTIPSVEFFIDHACTCSAGNMISCQLTQILPVPCCIDEVNLEPAEVCRTENSLSVALPDCSSLVNVSNVEWYISEAPCGSDWVNIYTTSSCQPLMLNPAYHLSDICVYANVYFGAGSTCSVLTTDTVTINLCQELNCSIAAQEYCYTGAPVSVAPLEVSVSGIGTCTYSIQWYEDGQAIPGAIGHTYQPNPIDFMLGSQECYQDVSRYTVEVTNACGTFSASSLITLYNEASDIGRLEIQAGEPGLPICPGEDLVIKFVDDCIGKQEKTWIWYREDNPPPNGAWSTLDNGDRNPFYNTNRIYESTWIRVEAQNGVCAPQVEDLYVEVYDESVVNSFSVDYDCGDDNVMLSLDYSSASNSSQFPDCDHTIEWYQNGQLIHIDVYSSSPATYAYQAGDREGNYYAIVKNNCCQEQFVSSSIEYVPPAASLAIAGPCFRCKEETIELNAAVSGAEGNCVFTWFDENGAVIGTDQTISVLPGVAGPVRLDMTCDGGCMLSASYDIQQCGINTLLSDVEIEIINRISLYPNPTHDIVNIKLDQPITSDVMVHLYTIENKKVSSHLLEAGKMNLAIDVEHVAPGTYVLKLTDERTDVMTKKVIKL